MPLLALGDDRTAVVFTPPIHTSLGVVGSYDTQSNPPYKDDAKM